MAEKEDDKDNCRDSVCSQWSFSSMFPLDVTDRALMNSSNSIDPSWIGAAGSTGGGQAARRNENK